MALYRYVYEQKKPPRRLPRFVPFALMGTGLGLLIWTIWPVVTFWVIEQRLLSTAGAGKSTGAFSPVVFASDGGKDSLADPNVWFPTKPQKKNTGIIQTYSLSIPKLKIRDATVTIAGDDLLKSLVHYGGTAIPGQYGTSVIFGHSTLPQFYSPTNYQTIFSLLPTLKVGDEFSVVYDNITYTYTIYDMAVLDPTDLSALEQQFDDSYVTLVTCVPPGTKWKRLNVRARLMHP